MTKKLFYLLTLLLMLVTGLFANQSSELMEFWKVQRRGANGSMSKYRPEYFQAAREAGLQYIRFCADRLPAEERDFLIGNADDFKELNKTDLKLLFKVLDEAHANDQKIVLTMLSLPGCRYADHNGEQDDYRLWKDKKYHEQAFEFWRQLASAVKGHPAIVGYNPLNEPHPERGFGHEVANRRYVGWLRKTRGTAADLNLFNKNMLKAIREVDSETPIFLDGPFYADVMGMLYMEVFADPNVLYSFHNIAPWQMAAFRANRGRYSYPDRVPGRVNGPGKVWTIDNLRELVEPVVDFMQTHNLPAYRIVAGEFWYDRRVPGCKEYLVDVIKIYNENSWHWSFWDFRSDGAWNGLDYELGDAPVEWTYWQAIENGSDPEVLKSRHDNPIWEVLKRGLAGIE